MGKDVVNGGLEPIAVGPLGQQVIYWRSYAGSSITHHAAPPDDATIDDPTAREMCKRAAEVGPLDFDMAIPPVWLPWWGTLPAGERAAVWRGCRALWARMTGPRW